MGQTGSPQILGDMVNNSTQIDLGLGWQPLAGRGLAYLPLTVAVGAVV
jgi:hypothetical protein